MATVRFYSSVLFGYWKPKLQWLCGCLVHPVPAGPTKLPPATPPPVQGRPLLPDPRGAGRDMEGSWGEGGRRIAPSRVHVPERNCSERVPHDWIWRKRTRPLPRHPPGAPAGPCSFSWWR
eukprot:gene20031-biopygen14602